VLVAEQPCDNADLHPGRRVVDIATGGANAAIAAARLGRTAIGVDYAPALLEMPPTGDRRSPSGRTAQRRRQVSALPRTPRSTHARLRNGSER
jgi:hypothetical protein